MKSTRTDRPGSGRPWYGRQRETVEFGRGLAVRSSAGVISSESPARSSA